jgi:acyl-coenzyme A thioesterase PaaI-like protein
MSVERVAAEARSIRSRVIAGISQNRVPGYHFPLHFLEVSFDEVSQARTLLSLDPGPHCLDSLGELHVGPLGLVADLAMSASIRAGLNPAQRLGTVSFHLHLTGAPGAGRFEAEATFQGFVRGGKGRLGTSRFALRSGGESIGFGGGSFMVLDPPKNVVMHPVTLRRRGDPRVPPLDERELREDERAILARAEAALAGPHGEGESFVERFWAPTFEQVEGGVDAAIDNGPHASNRVGHMQGGLLLGAALSSADAALESAGHVGAWGLTGASISYISPGEGARLSAAARIVHRGGLTAVVRTEVKRPDGRRVLEVTSQHAARARER